jgi:hypothetical protein
MAVTAWTCTHTIVKIHNLAREENRMSRNTYQGRSGVPALREILPRSNGSYYFLRRDPWPLYLDQRFLLPTNAKSLIHVHVAMSAIWRLFECWPDPAQIWRIHPGRLRSEHVHRGAVVDSEAMSAEHITALDHRRASAWVQDCAMRGAWLAAGTREVISGSYV